MITLWICTVLADVFDSGMTKRALPFSPARSVGRIKWDLRPPAASPGLKSASKANNKRTEVLHQPCTQAVHDIANSTLRGRGALMLRGCVRFHCFAAFHDLCNSPIV
eukprot:1808241-Amphidinium_carterae.1